MNALQRLISEKVFSWPEGIDMLCVSKRSQWMLRHAVGEKAVGEQTAKLFARLGPCSSIYRHQSFSRIEFENLQNKRRATSD